MSNQERPSGEESIEQHGAASGVGRSGSGADSAMKQLREWEQSRSDDRDGTPIDKPASH